MYKPLNDLKQIFKSKKQTYDYASIFIKTHHIHKYEYYFKKG